MKKTKEGFYSVIRLTDLQQSKSVSIGIIVTVPGEFLKTRFKIDESTIERVATDEAQFESLMALACLCRSRLNKHEAKSFTKADLEKMAALRSGSISFAPETSFKVEKDIEAMVDDMFSLAVGAEK